MVKEVYQIVIAKTDDDMGFETGWQVYRKEYENHPTTDEIAKVIHELNGDVARIEKKYRAI